MFPLGATWDGGGVNFSLFSAHAKQLVGSLQWDLAIFGYTLGSTEGDLSFDERDSAPFVPKSKVVATIFDWGGHDRFYVLIDQAVIYEAHVRGISMLHPDVKQEHRGTFSGLADPHMLSYLKSLGVTSIPSETVGNSIQKVLPRPSMDSKLMVPPIFSTNSLVIARPNPVPPFARVSELSA